MHLNAAIALQGLSSDVVDDVVERIRCLLHQVDPNVAYVGVEVKSVGGEFGDPDMLPKLLVEAERHRRDLLCHYWGDRNPTTMLASQRVGHAMATMNAVRIRLALEETVIVE